MACGIRPGSLGWLPALAAASSILLCQPAVAQSCTVSSSNGSYGTIDVASGLSVDTTASFTVTCTGGANQTVRMCLEIDKGDVNSSGQRVLLSASDDLRHELYTNASRTTIWGSALPPYSPYPFGVQSDLALGASGANSASFTIYGRILGAQQDTLPGSYTWSSSEVPKLKYAYVSGQSCPLSSGQTYEGGTVSWTATVAASCTVSATSASFGSAAVLSSVIDTTSTVSVLCTSTTPFTVGLNAGTGAGATVATRKMTSGGNTVNYTLYQNAGRTIVWGNTIGTDTVAGTGTGAVQNITAYGRVPTQSTPAPGAYADTIVVTVTY